VEDGDNTIKLWRVSDGALLKSYDEETVGVLSIAFSPDGRLIAWGRGDATVVVARNPFPVGAPVKPPQPPCGFTDRSLLLPQDRSTTSAGT
jgi:WD40 repeat protein